MTVVRPVFLLHRIPRSMNVALGMSVQQAPHRNRTLPWALWVLQQNVGPGGGSLSTKTGPRSWARPVSGCAVGPTAGPGAGPTWHGSAAEQTQRKGNVCDSPLRWNNGTLSHSSLAALEVGGSCSSSLLAAAHPTIDGYYPWQECSASSSPRPHTLWALCVLQQNAGPRGGGPITKAGPMSGERPVSGTNGRAWC